MTEWVEGFSFLLPIFESMTWRSTIYDSLSSSSSYERYWNRGGKPTLTILQQEKTEEERTVMEEIGQALEDKRYSYAMKIFAGALFL